MYYVDDTGQKAMWIDMLARDFNTKKKKHNKLNMILAALEYKRDRHSLLGNLLISSQWI